MLSRSLKFVIKCYMLGSALLCSLMIAIFGNSYPSDDMNLTLQNDTVWAPNQMFTVINLTNIIFTLCSNTCDSTRTIHYIILVNSALGNKDYRDIIRGSWGRPRMRGVVTRLVFLLGATENVTLQEEIIAESREHGDLVQGSILDTYRNLTYKSVMGHVWVRYGQDADNVKLTLYFQ